MIIDIILIGLGIAVVLRAIARIMLRLALSGKNNNPDITV